MNKSEFWDSYLSIEANTTNLKEQLCSCGHAFAAHKKNISRLIAAINPSSIAVLGSGYLNDIPLHDLLEKNRRVYLVDWIESASKIGVAKNIIYRQANNRISCLFCSLNTNERYCKNHSGKILRDGVCTGYEEIREPFDSCRNYSPATAPYFLKADITGGTARNFSEKVTAMISTCKTVKQAFIKAISVAETLKYSPIEIQSNSIDLVTSSMVLSQFDVEPYTYFSRLIENKFGRSEIIRLESKLYPLMEKLRNRLFKSQVESHIKEIYRILNNNDQSRAYLSAELFRSFPDRKRYFLVQGMPGALEIIGKYFYYEFDDDLESNTLKKSYLGDGISINQCYVLTPRNEGYHQ